MSLFSKEKRIVDPDRPHYNFVRTVIDREHKEYVVEVADYSIFGYKKWKVFKTFPYDSEYHRRLVYQDAESLGFTLYSLPLLKREVIKRFYY